MVYWFKRSKYDNYGIRLYTNHNSISPDHWRSSSIRTSDFQKGTAYEEHMGFVDYHK